MSIELTKTRVESLAKGPRDQFLWDSKVPGFGVKVTPAGKRVYILQYRMPGEGSKVSPRRFTIGAHGRDFTVKQARDQAIKLRGQIRSGTNPREEQRAAAQPVPERDTFAKTADDYLAHAEKSLRPSSLKEWKRIIEYDVKPRWGKRATADITRRDVRELLDEITKRGAEVQANRTRARLLTLFTWAIEQDIIPASPIAGLRPLVKETERDRVLSDDEIRWFWKGCDAIGEPFGSLFKLLLLTAQRRDEVGTMEWPELDLDNENLWTIPRDKAKNDRAHEVHLSEPAITILSAIKKARSRGDSEEIKKSTLVFTTDGKVPVSGFSRAKDRLDVLLARNFEETAAAQKGRALEPSATTGGIKVAAHGHEPFGEDDVQRIIGLRYGDKWGYARITEFASPKLVHARVLVPFGATDATDTWLLGPGAWILHDLRRTAATGMAKLNIAPHVVDKILNHVSGTIRGVAAIYNRHAYTDERKAALDAWARYVSTSLAPTAPNVVSLRAR